MLNNQFLALLLICFFSIFLAACGDDDISVNGTMTATVDGESWEAEMPLSSYVNGVMGIAGVSDDDQSIILSLMLPTLEVTDLQLNQTATSAIAYTATTGAIAHTSNGNTTAGGTVMITDVDTEARRISGTFESLCVRAIDNSEVDITDGQFTSVPYAITLPPTESSLSVNIDGTSWTAASVTGSVAFGRLALSASDAAVTQTVGFSFVEDIGPGVYPIGLTGNVTGLYNVNSPNMIIHGATSGTMTVLAHDIDNNTINGTFEFIATDEAGTGANTVNLTNGEFTLSY